MVAGPADGARRAAAGSTSSGQIEPSLILDGCLTPYTAHGGGHGDREEKGETDLRRTSGKKPQAAKKKPRAAKKKASVSTRGRRSPSRPARPRTSSDSGTVNRVTDTLATALGGVTEATLEFGSTAMSAVGNSVRAAQQIGGEVVKATAAAAAGSIEAAQRAWRGGVKPPEGSRPSPPRRR